MNEYRNAKEAVKKAMGPGYTPDQFITAMMEYTKYSHGFTRPQMVMNQINFYHRPSGISNMTPDHPLAVY